MKRFRLLSPLALASLAGAISTVACVSGSADGEGAASAISAAAPRGWTTRPVSATPGTIGHHGRLAFLPGGQAIAAWSEPDAKDYSIQNIWTATLGESGWSKGPHITSKTITQHAFPALAVAGDRLHVVWNGAPEGDNDIFHVALEGRTWSSRTDLTSALEPDSDLRTDYLPALAAAPDGSLAVAYNSRPIAEGSIDIRVLRLDAAGRPVGEPIVALSAPGGDCYGPTAAFDAVGHLHVVAECGLLNEEHLLWGTDASGAWTTRSIPPQGAVDGQAALARGVGSTLELVWTAFTGCPGGACGDIVAATIDGATVGAVRRVTSTPAVRETKPLAVVDGEGRLVVGFSSNDDAWITWSTGPTTFAPPMNLAPDSSATWEYVDALAVNPATGAPHVLFTKVFPGTQPLNAEIMHASPE